MTQCILIAFLLCAVLLTIAVTEQRCGKEQWQCRDGSCIGFDGRCDGVVDCADGSDETHPLCRHTPCQDHLFRCAYGACVDGTAPCNGVQDCADNSDELLLRCKNETRIKGGKFQCNSGLWIPVTDMCDGAPDCADSSDETVGVCAGTPCDPYLFQCAYGACVDRGAECDDTQDCFDNSDESDELCNRTAATSRPKPPPAPPSTPRAKDSIAFRTPSAGDCVLPPYPAHGRYSMRGEEAARPGDQFLSAIIDITCDAGYAVVGADNATCIAGFGFGNIPNCTRYCELKPHASVTYTCVLEDGDARQSWPCREREFPGTEVEPECRANYRGSPSHMLCMADGSWNHVAKCQPECGTITPTGKQYIIGGETAKHGELPWHAGIYTRTVTPYKQICGGSLATTTTVITAAHCFYDDKQHPAEEYAVALGKVYRPWNDRMDNQHAQKSNVSEIHLATKFRGAATNYQADIAIVILETEVVLQTFIRPVCVDFGEKLYKMQLEAGNMGKIAGWGLTAADGRPSQVLLVVQLPYVTYEQCYNDSPPDFHEYITGDKFCAGYLNGTSALCQGDSGGGLAFPETEKGVQRYYLRGIVSTAPRNKEECDPNARTTFTSVMDHQRFINKYINFHA